MIERLHILDLFRHMAEERKGVHAYQPGMRIGHPLDAGAGDVVGRFGQPVLAEEFERFLSETDETDLKSEYLLPVLVGKLLKEEKIRVKVLRSEDEWFGVTYKEDRENVTEAINRLIEKEIYPSCLYT